MRVIQILIFLCEKIVFMIQIRTYMSKILVIIGRMRFKLVKSEKLKVKSVGIFFLPPFLKGEVSVFTDEGFGFYDLNPPPLRGPSRLAGQALL